MRVAVSVIFRCRTIYSLRYPNGRLDGRFADGIVAIDCSRVELAGGFLDAPALSEGFRSEWMIEMHRARRGVRARSYRWTFRRGYHLRVAVSVIFCRKTIPSLVGGVSE